MLKTPIDHLGLFSGNELFIKREDFIPFSFGGNKARKAELFFKKIDAEGYDCIVTYGSRSSNHCRVVANACCKRGLDCFVISPEEDREITFNGQLMELFGARIITSPVAQIHATIEKIVGDLIEKGRNPFFIEGGGHGDIGTEAYVQCYKEIKEQEKQLGIYFDYIFFASGTGTTQAGLVSGQLLESDERKIVGISIARKKPRGEAVVTDSIKSYLGTKVPVTEIQEKTIFVDDYTTGYGKDTSKVIDTIYHVMTNYGIPLDATYTGKAFWGMQEYIKKEQIRKKTILFIHTGGTPLFFDTIRKQREIE